MKEHAHLDTWLQLAEQAVAFPNPAQVTYATAKEELRKFEVSLVFLSAIRLLNLFCPVRRKIKVSMTRRSEKTERKERCQAKVHIINN